MFKKYCKQDVLGLIKKTHINRNNNVSLFEGFTNEECLIVCLYQLKILNKSLKTYNDFKVLARYYIKQYMRDIIKRNNENNNYTIIDENDIINMLVENCVIHDGQWYIQTLYNTSEVV